ncbi:MAG: polysaccharide deacetylase family protein [Xanthobacteraceae bacterium]|nr:polysaccharide deacetylase family protein [Xanthobacteraceae bacterium]
MKRMFARASFRKTAIRLTLDALYFTGAFRMLRERCGGVGIILTLHHVRPARQDAFQPNRSLEITPEFLEAVILEFRRQGLEFIGLDEMHRRLCEGCFSNRFVCITFDDGYRDNLEYAYPILRQHRIPFAIFVASDFADWRGHLWWRTLESVASANDRVTIMVEGSPRTFACRSVAEKIATVRAVHQIMSGLTHEAEVRTFAELAAMMAIDTVADCSAACMSWKELSRLAADPLVTIGAHTVSHPHLRKLAPEAARREMEAGAARVESMLGVRPRHFAYPFGDASAVGLREFAYAAELGFRTALTTRPGVLSAGDRNHLTSLPRISVNGDYQRLRHLRVLEAGAATLAWNGVRRLKRAPAR